MTSCIFGPVPSRRLGRSLGIDLIPHKTCTYDCLYCQVGPTTNHTATPNEHIPLNTVIKELKTKLDTHPDYITLSGSGEPTLYAPLADLIDRIKDLTDIPIAVLTNGSLLWQPHIRQSLMRADLVAPSLNAGSPATFQKINRPHPDITFDKMLEGLIQFRREFTGQYWLEVFIIEGINTDPAEIQNLAHCIARIDPDRVQLNTATRPTADPSVLAVAPDKLRQIAAQISDKAEVIADFPHKTDRELSSAQCLDVLNLLQRRPCSLDDIAAGLALKPYQASKYVDELLTAQKIIRQTKNNKTYYLALEQPSP